MFRTARPPSMRDLSCPGCAGQVAWKVDPIRERGPVDGVMSAWWDAEGRAVGRFAVWACAACGLCEWWAQDIGGSPAPPAEPGAFPRDRECVGCGSGVIHVVPMHDAVRAHVPIAMRAVPGFESTAGRLHALICAGCGLARWMVAGLHRMLVENAVAPAERACASCGGGFVWATWAVDAEAQAPAADDPQRDVMIFSTRRLAPGRAPLLLHLCSDCSHVSWFATGLEELAVDPRTGVVRLAAPGKG